MYGFRWKWDDLNILYYFQLKCKISVTWRFRELFCKLHSSCFIVILFIQWKNVNCIFVLCQKWWLLFIYCWQVLWSVPCKRGHQPGSFLPQLFATNHSRTLHLCWTGTWITATTIKPWNQVPWAHQSTVFGLMWRSVYIYSYSLDKMCST